MIAALEIQTKNIQGNVAVMRRTQIVITIQLLIVLTSVRTIQTKNNQVFVGAVQLMLFSVAEI